MGGFYEDCSQKKVHFDAKPVIKELSQPAQDFNYVASGGNSAAGFNLDVSSNHIVQDTTVDLDVEENLPVEKPQLVDCQECFSESEEMSSEIMSHVHSSSEEVIENGIEGNPVPIEETQDNCQNNGRIKRISPQADIFQQIRENVFNLKPVPHVDENAKTKTGGCPPVGINVEDGKNNERKKRTNTQADFFKRIREKDFTLKPVPQVDENSEAHKRGGWLPSGRNGEEVDEKNLTPLELVMKRMVKLRKKISQGGDTSIPKDSDNTKWDEEDSEEVTL